MSLSDALEHINRAGLLLQAASKTLSGHDPTPIPPYTPAVGDVIRWPTQDFVSEEWIVIRGDEARSLSRAGRSSAIVNQDQESKAEFLRRATPAEMASFGIVEKDVKPGNGFDISVAVGSVDAWIPAWMLADKCPMVARFGARAGGIVPRTAFVKPVNDKWEVEIDPVGDGFGPRAFCDTKAQALEVGDVLAGQRLDWKRWF